MTMTAEPTADLALAPMTAPEARACVDRIKGSMEDIRSQLWELKERQGWKALGYPSFQDCIRDEFAMSRQRAYQLVNAYTVDRLLAGDDVSTIVDTAPIPESHARELAPLLNEPDAVRTVVASVREEKGEQATAEDVRAKVDEHLARPPRTARAAKPAATVRRSIGSRAEASDFGDAPADDDALGFGDTGDGAFGFNNEPPKPASAAEHWCPDCGGKYRGERCPCATTPAPMEGGSETPGPYLTDDTQAGEDAPISDQPGAAEAAGVGSSPDAVAADEGRSNPDSKTPAPPAAPSRPHPSEQEDRPLDTGKSKGPNGKRTVGTLQPNARVTAPPTLSVGDLTRALFDFPAAPVGAEIAEALTAQERGSLAGEIIDALPTAEVERLAHRINVRARADAPSLVHQLADRSPAEVAELVGDAVPAERLKDVVAALTERMLARARAAAAEVN